MSEALLNLLSAYGLPGLVIFGMGWALYQQKKDFQEERKLWNEERKAYQERFEKYLEVSVDVIKGSTLALAELKTLIQYQHKEVK